ncbi:hypothetical protein EDB19DRAFT_1912030 [Suillus lakei]|nr:hypothetical protein EDB19DRAFT_1912030 [Suillus lakei]
MPGNANKHARQVSAEKLAKATALDNAQKQVAAKEDAMAVEQMAQSVRANPVSQGTGTPKKKYPGLKLTFKDGVNTSRKVSNTGVSSLSETHVGSTIDNGKFQKSLASESSILSEGAGVGKWARSVALKSQLKPSAPPSACASVITNNDTEGFEDDDPPEDHDDSVTMSRGGQGIMHIFQTTDDAPRGQKRGFSTVLLDDFKPEEQCEMEEDQDADEDVWDEDVVMTDRQGDIEVCEVSSSQLTTSMSVGIMETATDNQKSKYIKTEHGHAPCTLNLKKEKPKNSHLPSSAQNSTFHSIFIPMVIHWVGNSNYPWTILEKELSDVLEDISMAVYPHPGNFQHNDGCNLAFNVVSQRISEWRGNFGSTAITILMAFFASTDEYKTKEAWKAYAKYQLEDSCFVYEDPERKDSPGAFYQNSFCASSLFNSMPPKDARKLTRLTLSYLDIQQPLH